MSEQPDESEGMDRQETVDYLRSIGVPEHLIDQADAAMRDHEDQS